jgi:hypothetical protein
MLPASAESEAKLGSGFTKSTKIEPGGRVYKNRNQIAIFQNDLKSKTKSNRFTTWQNILAFIVHLSTCIKSSKCV